MDQDGPAPITDTAHASTLRLRTGFKTGAYAGFQGLVEFDLVGNLGADDYNDSVNSQTQYPLIADPSLEMLNQLWVSWSGLPGTSVRLGRQAINLDNQRFIGTVGWRQNDQTFDAVTIENKSIDKLSLLYGYIGNVNRVFGPEHPLGNYDSETHLAHATYAFQPWMILTGYGYWMDFDLAPASSSRTFGLRLSGEHKINDRLSTVYAAEAAEQRDHGNNPANYDATYYHINPGLKIDKLTLAAGFESLEGNGASAFQTPLATLHAFNGWADKFLTTPVNGLEDVYGKISYIVSGVSPWADSTVLDAVYHNYSAEHTSADYGTEWNLQISRTFETEKETYPFKEWSASIKYADYSAEDILTDTQKIWLTLGTKF
ncbi:MAG: alginate export family protein [Micavibrio sp.]